MNTNNILQLATAFYKFASSGAVSSYIQGILDKILDRMGKPTGIVTVYPEELFHDSNCFIFELGDLCVLSHDGSYYYPRHGHTKSSVKRDIDAIYDDPNLSKSEKREKCFQLVDAFFTGPVQKFNLEVTLEEALKHHLDTVAKERAASKRENERREFNWFRENYIPQRETSSERTALDDILDQYQSKTQVAEDTSHGEDTNNYLYASGICKDHTPPRKGHKFTKIFKEVDEILALMNLINKDPLAKGEIGVYLTKREDSGIMGYLSFNNARRDADDAYRYDDGNFYYSSADNTIDKIDLANQILAKSHIFFV